MAETDLLATAEMTAIADIRSVDTARQQGALHDHQSKECCSLTFLPRTLQEVAGCSLIGTASWTVWPVLRSRHANIISASF